MWVFFPQDVAKNYISKYKEGSAKQTDVVLFAQHNKRHCARWRLACRRHMPKKTNGGINNDAHHY